MGYADIWLPELWTFESYAQLSTTRKHSKSKQPQRNLGSYIHMPDSEAQNPIKLEMLMTFKTC